MSKEVNYLNEDPVISGQKWVCLSFLQPSKDDQTTLTGIKIRGVFDEYDEACRRAKQLQEIDPAFGVFVGEVGKWLPYDPDPDSKYVKSSEYANEELNTIMKNYLVNQEKAKVYHEKRKNEMTRQNLEGNIEKLAKQYSSTKRKLEGKTVKGSMRTTLSKRMTTMSKRLKDMEEKVKVIKEQEDKLLEEMKAMDKSKGKPQMNLSPPRNVDIVVPESVEETQDNVVEDTKDVVE